MKAILLSCLAIMAVACSKSGGGDPAAQGGPGGQPVGSPVTANSSDLAQALAGRFWCDTEAFQNEQGQMTVGQYGFDKSGQLVINHASPNGGSQPTQVATAQWSAGTDTITVTSEGETTTAKASFNGQGLLVIEGAPEDGGDTTLQDCGTMN